MAFGATRGALSLGSVTTSTATSCCNSSKEMASPACCRVMAASRCVLVMKNFLMPMTPVITVSTNFFFFMSGCAGEDGPAELDD